MTISMALTLLLIGSLFTNANQGVVVGFLCYEVCIGVCVPPSSQLFGCTFYAAGCVGICEWWCNSWDLL